MVCHATTCRMARNPSRVAVKRREVGGLQGEAFSALDLSEIGCVESHPTRISGRSSVDPAPRRCHCRHFQGQNRHFQGRRRRNFHTRQIRKSLGGFSKISRHANRNKITVRSFHLLQISHNDVWLGTGDGGGLTVILFLFVWREILENPPRLLRIWRVWKFRLRRP